MLPIRRGIRRERSARPAFRNLLRYLAGKFVRPRRLAWFTPWRRRFRIGLPGGIPGGGSVGVPGVAGGISGGSIGIYIVTLRFSVDLGGVD